MNDVRSQIDHHPGEGPDAAFARLPTSEFLDNLLTGIAVEHVSIGWVIAQLGERSFGLFMLILAAIGIAPGISTFIGVLLLVPAVQMMLGRRSPTLPRFLAERRVPVAKLRYGIDKTVPLLRRVEKLIRPRWHTGLKTTQRVVGGIVLLLGVSMLGPVPFSQVVPALSIMLVALAYLEEDGLVLGIAIVIAIASILVTVATVWATVIAGGAIFDQL